MYLLKFLLLLQIHSFDQNAAESYDIILAILDKDGNIIGPMDLLIAVQTDSQEPNLISNSLKEF